VFDFIPHWLGATFISIVIVLSIIFIMRVIVRSGTTKAKFLDVLRGKDGKPSLAIFQFFVWTILVLFGIVMVSFVRIFGGYYEYPVDFLPVGMIAIMGISTAVPVIRNRMQKQHEGIENEEPLEPASAKKIQTRQRRKKQLGFKSMLQEKGSPTLTRYQMFAWTWIGVTIYLTILFSTVVDIEKVMTELEVLIAEQEDLKAQIEVEKEALIAELEAKPEGLIAELEAKLKTVNEKISEQIATDISTSCDSKSRELRCLTLPDIDPTLVILMGMSQGAYLGGAFYNTKPMSYSLIRLHQRFENGEITADEFIAEKEKLKVILDEAEKRADEKIRKMKEGKE